MEAAWKGFEKKAVRQVLSAPLPRNVLPQLDPITGKMYFLFTRTGALQAEHPGLKALKPRLQEQKVQAHARLRQRLATLGDYAERLRLGGAQQEALLLAALAEARARSLAPTKN